MTKTKLHQVLMDLQPKLYQEYKAGNMGLSILMDIAGLNLFMIGDVESLEARVLRTALIDLKQKGSLESWGD